MDVNRTFKPTVEWMTARYAEMNDLLFGGRLGECKFGIFTTGNGSTGRVLGWFKMNGCKVEIFTRRMYKRTMFNELVYINANNFANLVNPKIEINGNYSGTEHAFLATLVHEMCHYYTYMDGYCPKQAHGPEFRQIASIVSSRSNGEFTVQRIAKAEEMEEMVLNDTMTAKRLMLDKNGTPRMFATFRFMTNGVIKLTTTASQNLIQAIINLHSARNVIKVLVSNDINLLKVLLKYGYMKNMRSLAYWDISKNKWIGDIVNGDYDIKEFVNPMFNDETPQQEVQPKVVQTNPRMIFSIRTSTGVFETECSSFAELRAKLQQRFPNMSYETISKLMGNRNNFKKLEENKMNTKKIIESVINEFMENEFGDDSIEITPDMNLGLQSPLEET